MANPKVVFLQGAKKKEQVFPWMFFHFHPTRDDRPDPVDLVFFDFLNGEIKTWKNWTAPRDDKILQNPDSVDPLDPKVEMRLPDGSLDPGDKRSSVVGFYEWMKAQPAGSVVSLQVFSHGWRGGPILWDTYEYDSAGDELDEDDLAADRDPHDTDFRKRDFFGTNPGADPAFRDAFHPDAFIKLWGCEFEQDKREIVQRYWKVPKKRNARNDGKRDGHLADYLAAVENTFPMIMSQELGLPVWASPCGWGSTPWKDGTKYKGTFPPDLKKENWWRVSKEFRHNKKDRGVKFYEDILGAQLDAVDYVEYKDSWLQAAKTASADPPDSTSAGAPAALQQRLLDRIAQLQSRVTGFKGPA